MKNNAPRLDSATLALIEAELAASKARILEILKETTATGVTPPASLEATAPTIELQPTNGAATKILERRQRELHAIISSFEQRVGNGHDLGIVLQRFPDSAPLRLRAVTFFGTGAVGFIGLDASGRSATLYDTLDDFSIVLRKLNRPNRSQPRRPVEFYTVKGTEA